MEIGVTWWKIPAAAALPSIPTILENAEPRQQLCQLSLTTLCINWIHTGLHENKNKKTTITQQHETRFYMIMTILIISSRIFTLVTLWM